MLRKMICRTGSVLFMALLLAAVLPVFCFGDVIDVEVFDLTIETDMNVTVKGGNAGVDMHAGPHDDSPVMADKIPDGTVMHIERTSRDDTGNDWGYGEFNGTYGWVSMSLTEEHTDGYDPATDPKPSGSGSSSGTISSKKKTGGADEPVVVNLDNEDAPVAADDDELSADEPAVIEPAPGGDEDAAEKEALTPVSRSHVLMMTVIGVLLIGVIGAAFVIIRKRK